MKRKPHRFFLYLLLRFVHVIVLVMPYKIAVLLGSFFGSLAFVILPKYNRITLENLRIAFAGEKDEREIKHIAEGVFCNLGRTAAEYMSLPKFSVDRLKKLVPFGAENIDLTKRILSKGKGIIFLGSHFCNWEMLVMGGLNLDRGVTVIGRRIYYPPYNKFLVSLRESKGVHTLYRDDKEVLRKSLNILKSGLILGVVPDQDVDSVDGVFVDFFGRSTYTPTGPVILAMLSGAPLVPAFVAREGWRFRVMLDEPIYVKRSADRKQDIADYTQKWSNVVEKYIRKYPSNWVWMHKRWKTRPGRIKTK